MKRLPYIVSPKNFTILRTLLSASLSFHSLKTLKNFKKKNPFITEKKNKLSTPAMRIDLNPFSKISFMIKRESSLSLVSRPNLEIPEENRSQEEFC